MFLLFYQCDDELAWEESLLGVYDTAWEARKASRRYGDSKLHHGVKLKEDSPVGAKSYFVIEIGQFNRDRLL